MVFGYFKETQYSRALNLCILHAKQFISKQIYLNQVPFFLPFLIQLKNNLLLEKYICTRNSSLDMFESTLGVLLETLLWKLYQENIMLVENTSWLVVLVEALSFFLYLSYKYYNYFS